MADFRMDSAHRLDRFKPAVLDFLHAAPQRFAEDRPTPIDLLQADFTPRFPRIVEAVRRLKVRSVLIDGEGVVYNDKGMPSFNMIHSKQHDHAVSLVAFDLLELDGEDVRAASLLDRKARLARLVAKAKDGIEYNDHLTGAGAEIFAHACRLGHEGIVAKRIDLALRKRPIKALAEDQEPGQPGDAAGAG